MKYLWTNRQRLNEQEYMLPFKQYKTMLDNEQIKKINESENSKGFYYIISKKDKLELLKLIKIKPFLSMKKILKRYKIGCIEALNVKFFDDCKEFIKTL